MPSRQKKILILSLATGSGHIRAADAINKFAAKNIKHIQTHHIDITPLLPTIIQKTTVDAYDWITKHIPELWGLLYQGTDSTKTLAEYKKFSSPIIKQNAKKLQTIITNEKPDYILSTHFFCTDIYTSTKNTIPISTVLTDYGAHALWINPHNQHYFVATKKVKEELIERSVPPERITISGIPIDPIFYEPYHKKPADLTCPNILILSGGQGLISIDTIVKTLMHSQYTYHITAIAGKNNALYQKINTIEQQLSQSSLTTIGWTDQIHTYMQQADVIITKPGGLTTTECITLGIPIIAINPIPGQEEANARYINNHGYGFIAKQKEELPELIKKAIQKKYSVTKKSQKKTIAAASILETISPTNGHTE